MLLGTVFKLTTSGVMTNATTTIAQRSNGLERLRSCFRSFRGRFIDPNFHKPEVFISQAPHASFASSTASSQVLNKGATMSPTAPTERIHSNAPTFLACLVTASAASNPPQMSTFGITTLTPADVPPNASQYATA
ncbi:uncharacterized protein BCR38DRAFT_482771 [Pseudomassariella vexata]|uniref:Uncharacterized protein n=1 Tax=Pseudomassariella vexata TaxID=1141098 RepID=A0A1Y2E6H8_9PEZI|nr:uncharacterized protein BCR38DRAFT_482771 [Pseudomassariella vexata]ORY67132.1 hypothetical protein BCR38DRAFT_482771 [Pseudomassariella vexata]